MARLGTGVPDAPGAGRAGSEEAVLDRLADEIARAADNHSTHSAKHTA